MWKARSERYTYMYVGKCGWGTHTQINLYKLLTPFLPTVIRRALKNPEAEASFKSLLTNTSHDEGKLGQDTLEP